VLKKVKNDGLFMQSLGQKKSKFDLLKYNISFDCQGLMNWVLTKER